MGFAQSGLLPIVEIPYAKYVDCGFDMLTESGIMAWLSNGQQTNGMIIRLQGFGPGVFGGNYHTHNMIHLLPGVHVVCFSNGHDWAKGWRHAVQLAKKGSVVMVVDSTSLLNLRHVEENDDQWRLPYPAPGNSSSFEDVVHYAANSNTKSDVCIVSYGPGLVASLQAQSVLQSKHNMNVDVVDAPYLSAASEGLKQALAGRQSILFADTCKQATAPLAMIASQLHSDKAISSDWQVVCSASAYNPLGSMVTFLNEADITSRMLKMCGKGNAA